LTVAPANSRVIIVEDDEAVRDSLAALLDATGFDVVTYASGQAFLDAAPPADAGCLVLDVRLPGFNGLDLLDTIKARGIAVPVIIMTGHGDIPMAVRAIRAGAIEFIEKPFTEDVMLDSVRRGIEASGANQNAAPQNSASAAHYDELTPRERDVMTELVIGNPNKVIAYDLGISPRTVEVHRARVMEKMHARNLSHLVHMGIELGLGTGGS
jgi:two-component system response regulator FixJ